MRQIALLIFVVLAAFAWAEEAKLDAQARNA